MRAITSLRLALGASCWLLAAASLPAIDFTPRYADLNEDGLRVRTMYIQDGPQQVFLDVPAGWTASAGGGGLTLQSSRINQAVIQVREAGSAPPKKFDESWIATASSALLKSLPPDSKGASITSQKPSPIGANGWKSFALFSSFDYFGQRLGRAQCIIDLDGARALEVVCTAQEKDIGNVFQQAMAVMASWYVIKTGVAPKGASDKDRAAAPAADAPPAPATAATQGMPAPAAVAPKRR